jgi:ABC-type bacteriocin/lantibiotic exporter with double-glycine peptidase domain
VELLLSYSFTLSLSPRINFAQRHTQIDQVDANGDTYEFEFFDPKWTRSADKIAFLPATRRREEQRRKKNKTKEPSLVWALVRTFWRTFVFAGMLKFFQDLLNFVSPQLLKYIIV